MVFIIAIEKTKTPELHNKILSKINKYKPDKNNKQL